MIGQRKQNYTKGNNLIFQGGAKMLPYMVVALWPLIVYSIFTKGKIVIGEKEINFYWYVILAMLPMFIMIGFRSGNLGADTNGYLNNFIYVNSTPFSEVLETSRMEKGYLIFVKLITYITKYPLVYQLICTFIYFIGVLEFAKTLDKKDVFLFIFFVCTLGLFFFMFTGVRQSLAMSICLFGYKYSQRRKIIPFILCVLLAFCFHKSAILFIVVYFMVKMKVTWYNTVAYAVGLWIVTTYLFDIQEWFNEQLEYDYGVEKTNSGGIFVIILALLTVFSMVMIYNNHKFNKDIQAFMNINFITVFFWLLRLQTRVAERPSMYFMFMSCALYAYGLNCIKNNQQRFIFKFIIIVLSMLFYVYRLNYSYSGLVPYKFY